MNCVLSPSLSINVINRERGQINSFRATDDDFPINSSSVALDELKYIANSGINQQSPIFFSDVRSQRSSQINIPLGLNAFPNLTFRYRLTLGSADLHAPITPGYLE